MSVEGRFTKIIWVGAVSVIGGLLGHGLVGVCLQAALFCFTLQASSFKKQLNRRRWLMDRKRSYEDGCAFAQALDLVGERWALLIMRELMFGPKRFTDLKDSLPGIATNVLTQRLSGLEEAGVLRKVDLPR